MKLTRDGIKDRAAWEQAGIALPGYDVEAVSEKAKEEPGWVHFGIGNIFRVFIGGIADGLLEEGVLDRGITCGRVAVWARAAFLRARASKRFSSISAWRTRRTICMSTPCASSRLCPPAVAGRIKSAA